MGLDPSKLSGSMRQAYEDQVLRAPQAKLEPAHGTVTSRSALIEKKLPFDKLNKTERRCYDYLRTRGIYTSVLPFAITLWLGTEIRYCPDFLCHGGLKPVIVECKGPYIYPRSLNKFKAAVTIFPSFSFRILQWKDETWAETKYS